MKHLRPKLYLQCCVENAYVYADTNQAENSIITGLHMPASFGRDLFNAGNDLGRPLSDHPVAGKEEENASKEEEEEAGTLKLYKSGCFKELADTNEAVNSIITGLHISRITKIKLLFAGVGAVIQLRNDSGACGRGEL